MAEPGRKRIGEMLLHDGIITQEQLNWVLDFQKKNPGRKFGEILVKEGIIEKKLLMEYLLEQIK